MNCKFNKPGLNKFIPVDPITIKEPLNKDLKTFESIEEFTIFYRQNESLFKDPNKNTHLSANLLNRLYSVPGYKISITKRGSENEESILIKDYRSKYSAEKNSETTNAESDNLNNEILESLTNKINILTKRLDNIESYLEQLK